MRAVFFAVVVVAVGCASAQNPESSPPKRSALKKRAALKERTAIVEGKLASPALCQFVGSWKEAHLLAPVSGIDYATINTSVTAALVREDDGLRFFVRVDEGGWHLRGVTEPAKDVLEVRKPMWLGDIFALLPGARVRVLDARPGKALVRPTEFSEGAGYQFRDRVETWLACEDLSAGIDLVEPEALVQARASLGLPAKISERRPRIISGAAMSATFGGPPRAKLPAYDFGAHVIEERGQLSRVIIDEYYGLLVGWIPTATLGSVSSYRRSGFVSFNSPFCHDWPATVCQAAQRLDLLIRTPDGELERVGWLDPATPFRRTAVAKGGGFEIRPIPQRIPGKKRANRSIMGRFVVRPTAHLACHTKDIPPPTCRCF